jgi:hypothetical protein
LGIGASFKVNFLGGGPKYILIGAFSPIIAFTILVRLGTNEGME